MQQCSYLTRAGEQCKLNAAKPAAKCKRHIDMSGFEKCPGILGLSCDKIIMPIHKLCRTCKGGNANQISKKLQNNEAQMVELKNRIVQMKSQNEALEAKLEELESRLSAAQLE